MSIIYDALKKVQKSIDKDNPDQGQTPLPPQAKAKIRPVFIYILVVCLGLVLGNFAYNFFSHPAKKKNQIKNEITAQPKQTALPLSVKLTAETPAPGADTSAALANPEPVLVLSGVFFEQGDGYALINNRIARVGDEIEHAKVKQITMGGVDLEFEGKTIKLLSPS